MSAYMEKVELNTDYKGFHNISQSIQEVIDRSEIENGWVLIHCHHTTASLTLTSFWDKKGHLDMMEDMDRLIPSRNDFHHVFDTPTDAAGHIKTSILGSNLNLIVKDNKLFLGSSQGAFFVEFDGPRDRQFYVKVFSD